MQETEYVLTHNSKEEKYMKRKKIVLLSTVLTLSCISLPMQAGAAKNETGANETDGEPYSEFWENYQWDALNTWIQEENGQWWYRNADGGYTTNGWQRLNAKWYYFDEEGWMKTGWLLDNNTWYYLKSDGEMATGWVSDGNAWYYLSESGALTANTWVQENSLWYYLKANGAMAQGEWIDKYYIGANGVWIPDTFVREGTWILGDIGWRFQLSDGSNANGWIQLEDGWYYLSEEGYMVSNAWIDNYYVTDTGKMLTNDWLLADSTVPFNRLYYVGNDGEWVPDAVYHGADGVWKKDSNGWWFQRADGSYPAGEFECVKDKWYFFDTDGYRYTGLLKHLEIGGYYYFYEDGSMAVDTTIEGRYFDAQGRAQ